MLNLCRHTWKTSMTFARHLVTQLRKWCPRHWRLEYSQCILWLAACMKNLFSCQCIEIAGFVNITEYIIAIVTINEPVKFSFLWWYTNGVLYIGRAGNMVCLESPQDRSRPKFGYLTHKVSYQFSCCKCDRDDEQIISIILSKSLFKQLNAADNCAMRYAAGWDYSNCSTWKAILIYECCYGLSYYTTTSRCWLILNAVLFECFSW